LDVPGLYCSEEEEKRKRKKERKKERTNEGFMN
jgi:hypothetical protein